ncbi:MAG: dephospho-CoA kinase [Planctomycetes bacterium]|nr:dephospho-CoA kinase [Planctomycetota bacterium]
MQRPKLVVGLVGGVAGGKSTVAALFRKLGAGCVHADEIAHRALNRPSIRRAVARAFGPDVLTDDEVDRRALARRAFRSARDIRRLNAIVHPQVVREIRAKIRAARGLLIVDAALLQETGADAWCDVVVYVDTPRKAREARARRRGWSLEELRRRERLQWSPARKRAGADIIIRNGGSLAATKRQVERLYLKLVKPFQE